jgi:hypothetical protein
LGNRIHRREKNHTGDAVMKVRIMILTILVCSGLVPITAFAQNKSEGQANPDTTELIQKEILHLEEVGRQKALRGEKHWDDLMADGAYLIRWDGTTLVYQKGQELPALPLKSFILSDLIARVYGEVTVVTALATIDAETPDKKPFSYKYRYMNVWKKSIDGWKIVVTGGTVVKQAAKS